MQRFCLCRDVLFLIGNAWRAVVGVYYPASDETGSGKNMLHYGIVCMGVGPEIVYALPAPVNAGRGNSMGPPVGCEPVNRPVWIVRKPSSLFNDPVCGVFSYDQTECPDNVPVCILAYVAVQCLYFRDDEVP